MTQSNKKLPDGWINTKFEDELGITKGLTYKSNDYAKSGNDGQVFLTLKSIEKGGGFNKDGVKYYKGEYQNKHVVYPGDLIIANTDLTRSGDVVGAPIIVPKVDSDKDYVMSMDLSKIDVKSNLDKLYVYYLLSSPYIRNKMKAFSTGSTVLHLNLNSVKKITFVLPPISQQKKIAQVLATIDKALHKTDKIIRQTELLKKGLMQDLFTKGIGHKKFKQTKVGTIPEEWEVLSIQELIDKKYIEANQDGNHGNDHPKADDYVKDGIPFLTCNVVKNGSIDFNNCNYISREQADRLRIGFSYEGDVLITHKGTLGEVALVKNIPFDYIMLTPQVTYYRVISKDLVREYLYYYFQSSSFQNDLKLKGQQSTRAYLSITNQRKLEIAVPRSIKEQNRIATILSQVDNKTRNFREIKSQLLNLKNGLMQDLLTGRRLVN